MENPCDVIMNLVAQGKYERALSLAVSVHEEIGKQFGEDNVDYALSLNNLAFINQQLGNYNESESLYRKAIAIWRSTGNEEHPDYATTLDNLAAILHGKGNYQDAESFHRQAMEIRKKILGEDNLDYARSLNNLAMLYRDVGNYDEAIPLLRQTIEIHKKVGESSLDYATSLNNLAVVYQEIGNYDEAESLLFQVKEIHKKIIGEDHPDYAISLNNLALVYQEKGNYEEAQSHFLQALAIFRKSYGKENADYAMILYNLANLYLDSGNYSEVEEPLRQSMEINRKIWGDDNRKYALCLNTLAWLHKKMGNYDDAEPLLRQAIDIQGNTLGNDHPENAQVLYNLADLYIATNRAREGFHLMLIASENDTKTLGQIFSIGSDQQRLAYLESINGHFHKFISLVVSHCSNSPPAVFQALDLTLKRKAVAAEAFAVQREAIYTGKYPELKEQLHQLRVIQMETAQKILSGPGNEGLDRHEMLLADGRARSEAIEFELARKIPEMDFALQLRKADPTVVAKNLPAGSVLLEFVCFDHFNFIAVASREDPLWRPSRYVVFILKPGDPENIRMIDLGDAGEIDTLISQFRSACGHLENTYTSSGSALYSKVVEPILPVIGEIQYLFIAPDGELNLLPFDTLPVPGGGYLIDRYNIQYISVGRDILRFSAQSSYNPGKPLVIADPAYDLVYTGQQEDTSKSRGRDISRTPETSGHRSGGRVSRHINRGNIHFTTLPGTRVEGEHVARVLKVDPLLGQEAVEGKIKNTRSPHILHIATHGFFLENQEHSPTECVLHDSGTVSDRADLSRLAHLENPLLRSGLALAGANTWAEEGKLPPEAEDGLLNGEDVTGLDLTATDLVVLSACETGLGEVKRGEGVYGLRRSFILAGAKTIVMSLWSVEDDSTRTLMIDFYQRIKRGVPKSEALREAKLALRKTFPHPFFWGPFICQGDPGPLSKVVEE